MPHPFTLLFLCLLAFSLFMQLWLARRQITHIMAHRHQVPAQFSERIPLSAHQKAADYTCAKTRLDRISTLAGTGLLLILTLGGGIQALHTFWSAHLQGLPYGIALIFSVFALSALVDLPFSLYRQFVIEEQFGFNRMTPALFLADLGKHIALAAVIGIPVLAAILWLMSAMGTFWWFYVWAFWSVFNLLVLFIYPTWIAPLFNKFTPLADGELRHRIESLLQRCDFSASGLFVMDGSKRSSHGNAYFAGFGANKRIVFFDTLLERLQPAEIEAVLAHELGHFKRRHIAKRIALLFVLSLAFLWLLGQLIDAPWFYAGLGVSAQNTALALILFFLVVPIFTFIFSPLASLLSRRHEFEADAYAARHASAEDLIRALVKLYEDNAATLTPDSWHSLFYDSHPPAALRIAHLENETPRHA
ncbi:MAG: Protease HtpX [Betaproteobacteria bacterium ADurb.Bin341]|nr:MAG: Protease HtpX [Betaproteobacteria bacterium ADurb.Bin341]